MDIELIRTFVEVHRTRHFARASEHLCVTQAAVSARIKQLEGLLGQPLFTRERNNIQLTLAGHQLLPHAEAMLASWSRAMLATRHSGTADALVALGCVPSLREIYLDNWLIDLHRIDAAPRARLQVESLGSLEIVRRIRDRSLDLGIVYEPPQAPDLSHIKLTDFELLLVTTAKNLHSDNETSNYILVDWGTSFIAAQEADPEAATNLWLKTDSPMSAYQLLLSHGGSTYLASPMLTRDLAEQRIHVVKNAPVFQRSVYIVGLADTFEGKPAALIERLQQVVMRHRNA
ncbi:MAG: LysR family transcriptional regulator [Pseudomonadaceae bacterium]|nr:LysR family transcriptional regulator [Pseudomonadaceae bacterium]